VATAAAIPARGWLNLEEDIADEFAPYAQRYDEIDDAYERVSSHRKKARQEARRLQGKPPSPRTQPHRNKTQCDKRWRERVALLVLAGYCAKCKKKREPSRSEHATHCEECAAELQRRVARKRAEHVAAGRCRRGCGRPLSKRRYRGKPSTLCEECSAKTNTRDERVLAGYCAKCKKKREPSRSKRSMHCEGCAAELRRRIARKQAEYVAAGRCRRGCGRPLSKRCYRGKPSTLCEECSAKTNARTQQTHAAKRAAGICRMGCGRPIRRVERRYRGKGAPTLCEECTAEIGRQMARKNAENLAASRCITGCGRPIRKMERPSSGKPPVMCEECAAKQRARTKSLRLARKQAQDRVEGSERPARSSTSSPALRPSSASSPTTRCSTSNSSTSRAIPEPAVRTEPRCLAARAPTTAATQLAHITGG
jgi:hypothetical protein